MTSDTPCSPGVAVIIPTLDESSRISALLTHLRHLDVSEVQVVDGGSRDDTVELARRAGAKVTTALRGRALQLDAGVALTKSPVLWFLHADARPPLDAVTRIRAALEDACVVGGAFRTHTVLEGGPAWFTPLLPLADVRSRFRRLPYGDQALFCRREAYESVGGFPPWPLLEDVGLAERLSRRGRLITLDAAVDVSARRYRSAPLYYGAVMSSFPALWRAGVPLRWLARAYGQPR